MGGCKAVSLGGGEAGTAKCNKRKTPQQTETRGGRGRRTSVVRSNGPQQTETREKCHSKLKQDKTQQQTETREKHHSKLKQEKTRQQTETRGQTATNRNKRKHGREGEGDGVHRAVRERSSIHTHIYRYEARGTGQVRSWHWSAGPNGVGHRYSSDITLHPGRRVS